MEVEDARARIVEARNAISRHIPAHYMDGARFLDVGCGSGNGVIAALSLGAVFAMGIDRNPEEFGNAHFAQMAKEFGVDERSTTLVAADISSLSFFDCGFDVVMMLDSVEHVPDPAAFIRFCADALRPGGVGLIQASPLYYGAAGHHLWHLFPEETMPWVHLYPNFDDRLAQSGVSDWSRERFEELNKVTRGQLLAHIGDAGLRVLADNSDSHFRFPPMLEKFGHLIDMSVVPSVEDLLCDYVALLFTKPAPEI
jgi:SAM-dependent methyltransferase